MSDTTTTPKVEQIKNLRETKREMAAAKATHPATESKTLHHLPPKDVQAAVEQVPQPGSILSPVDGAKVLDMAKKVAEKGPAKKAAPKAAAKKTPASKAPAKAAAKKVAAKTPASTGPRVAPVPQDSRVLDTKAPKLVWEPKGDDGVLLAMGYKGGASADEQGAPRYQYRVQEGNSGGWFASQRLAKGGKWTTLGGSGKATDADQARRLAEFADAGAHWLAYTVNQGLTMEQVLANFSTPASKPAAAKSASK